MQPTSNMLRPTVPVNRPPSDTDHSTRLYQPEGSAVICAGPSLDDGTADRRVDTERTRVEPMGAESPTDLAKSQHGMHPPEGYAMTVVECL